MEDVSIHERRILDLRKVVLICIYSCISIYSGAQVTDCGNWLIVTPLKDCRDNLVYFSELKKGSKIIDKLPLTEVVDKLEADYEVSKRSIRY